MANEYIDAILSKKKREPENPYLPADGTLAQMKANYMAGYVPSEFSMPKLNPMLGYKSRYDEQSGGRPISLDSNVVKGQQPKDYTGYGMPEAKPEAEDGVNLEKYIFNGYSSPVNEKRIAEIDKRIAEIEAQLKEYDEEEEMGKYKFLYESDPSTYTSVKQNKRNAVQTEKLRKASEDATKASTVQTAWKENLMQLEANSFDIANAKANYAAAVKAGNSKDLESLNLTYKQTLAKRKRLMAENEILQDKMRKDLGMEMADEVDVNGVEGFDTAKDVASIETMDALKGEAKRLKEDYGIPNYSVPKTVRKKKYEDGVKAVNAYKKSLEDAKGKMDERERQSLLDGVAELERQVALWRPGSKDKNRPSVEPTAGDYVNATKNMTRTQLQDKSDAYLKATVKDYKAMGVPLTANLIAILDEKGIQHD